MERVGWPQQQPVLPGPVVSLWPWLPGDAGFVYAACQDPDIQQWTLVPIPYLPEHAHWYVTEHAPSVWAQHTGALWAITDTATSTPLGSCGIVNIDANLVGEVGYWVAPQARGHGVTVPALTLLADWALGPGHLTGLEFLIEPGNTASAAVAAKAGAVFDPATGETRTIPGDSEGDDPIVVHVWTWPPP